VCWARSCIFFGSSDLLNRWFEIYPHSLSRNTSPSQKRTKWPRQQRTNSGFLMSPIRLGDGETQSIFRLFDMEFKDYQAYSCSLCLSSFLIIQVCCHQSINRRSNYFHFGWTLATVQISGFDTIKYYKFSKAANK
jgi:hypothetical protein